MIKSNNDMFSRLNSLDIKQLLLELESFNLNYRDKLYISNDITFGTEIEFENIPIESVKEYLQDNPQFNDWIVKTDRSLNSGGEINSPILNDNLDTWKNLKTVCNILKNNGAKISENCGAHIHIGSVIFDDNIVYWLNLLKIWCAFEKIIFRFGYGETDKARRQIEKYAEPMANLIFQTVLTSYDERNQTVDLIEGLKWCTTKKRSINFQNVRMPADNDIEKNTIEIRCPNGTIEEIIWQNNINTFTKIISAIKNDQIDGEWLDNYIVNQMQMSNVCFKQYDKVYLNEALIFVDMIFDNNLDKMCFLRQYLKNYNKTTYQERQKRFIIN